MQLETTGAHVAETRRLGPADEERLRILIERMVREGRSESAITKAVCDATRG